MSTVHHAAQLAALLPGYRIERRLGRGSMSVVHLARHERLDRLVAVKELPRSMAADPDTRRRFEREARVLASLNHPHVVPVYDYLERDEHCLLIMEHLSGGTAWDRFSSAGFTGPEAVALVLATCSATHHAHVHGVLHRDLKPENLMFDGAGTLKVTDFGIAHVINGASTKITASGLVFGTPVYMAPEQASGGELGPSADVYSVGTVLYEMLTGRLPFGGASSVVAALGQRVHEDPIPISSVIPNMPPSLAEVTMRSLARDPHARYDSAEAFGRALAGAAAKTWGPRWLDDVGIEVSGNAAILDASRTFHLFPGAELSHSDAGDVAVRPVDDLATSRVHPDDEAVRRPPRFTAELAELATPFRRPALWYLVACLLAIGGVALAVLGFGESVDTPPPELATVRIDGRPLDGEPIRLDLGRPIELSGMSQFEPGFVSMSFDVVGIGLHTTPPVDITDGRVALDASAIEAITSGALTATVEIAHDGRTVEGPFAAEATRAGIATLLGAGSLVTLLLGLMGIETALGMIRRQRLRPGLVAGTALGGAVSGAALAVATTVFLSVPHSTRSLVIVAVVVAGASLVLGLATASRRRRHLSPHGRAPRSESLHPAPA